MRGIPTTSPRHFLADPPDTCCDAPWLTVQPLSSSGDPSGELPNDRVALGPPEFTPRTLPRVYITPVLALFPAPEFSIAILPLIQY